MENTKLERINELAKLAKERELTAEELAERDALRKEYIAEWRRGAEQVLENTYIVTPDGKKTKLQKKGVLVMGHEGRGVSPEVAAFVTDKLLIPSFSPDGEHVESLNVSVAAGVFIYEAIRQRGL